MIIRYCHAKRGWCGKRAKLHEGEREAASQANPYVQLGQIGFAQPGSLTVGQRPQGAKVELCMAAARCGYRRQGDRQGRLAGEVSVRAAGSS